MKNQITEAIKEVGHVIDLWIPMKIKYDKTPAISIAISHKGKIAYSKGFGYADVRHKIKATDKTKYHIASHSKMFTTVAIMKLVENKKIRLDDYVVDYIDWFRGKNKKSDASHITIRQLLSHMGGIFRDGDTPHWVTGKFTKNLQKSFSDKSLIIENQTTFKYTNYGFSVLGLVIEKVSEVSYEEYILQNIFKPLGMKDTYIDYNRDIKNIATGYGAEIPDQKNVIFKHLVTHAYAPATGFVSNAIDLVKFMSSLSLESYSKSVINRESIKEISRAHAKTGEGDEYGLGLDISYLKGNKNIGHGGGFQGFTTRTLLDTKHDVIVTVLTNSLASSAGRITYGLLESVYEIIDNKNNFKSKLKIKHNLYEGVFRCIWGDSIVTKMQDILVDFGPKTNCPLKNSKRLIPTSKPHTFIMKSNFVFSSYDEEAVFSDFKNGKADKLDEASMQMKRLI